MTQVCYYVGLDVHRKTIWYCMKTAAGEIVREGEIESRREALAVWAKTIQAPCAAASRRPFAAIGFTTS
jgi:transposase